MKHLLNLLAAVALLIWGTHLVRTGILRVFGANLRQLIAHSVSSRFTAVLSGIGVAATIFIVWQLRAHPGQKLFSFALSSILGGAVGNVVDRLMHGYVVDFLQFHYAGWYFPSFNLADSAITVGAACLILDELLRVRRER